LQPERLSERPARVAQEAKTFRQAIDRFGPGFEKLWWVAVRRSAAEDLEKVSQEVMQKVHEKQREIDQSPTLSLGKEVWVYGIHTADSDAYFLTANSIKEEHAWRIPAKMRDMNPIRLSVQAFNVLIHELKAQILEGKLDEQLHLTAEQLTYDRMCMIPISQLGYVPTPSPNQTSAEASSARQG